MAVRTTTFGGDSSLGGESEVGSSSRVAGPYTGEAVDGLLLDSPRWEFYALQDDGYICPEPLEHPNEQFIEGLPLPPGMTHVPVINLRESYCLIHALKKKLSQTWMEMKWQNSWNQDLMKQLAKANMELGFLEATLGAGHLTCGGSTSRRIGRGASTRKRKQPSATPGRDKPLARGGLSSCGRKKMTTAQLRKVPNTRKMVSTSQMISTTGYKNPQSTESIADDEDTESSSDPTYGENEDDQPLPKKRGKDVRRKH